MPEWEPPFVTTACASEDQNDPHVRIVEVDVDTEAYGLGHLRGAVGWSWETELSDRAQRELVPKAALEPEMVRGAGVPRLPELQNLGGSWTEWVNLGREPEGTPDPYPPPIVSVRFPPLTHRVPGWMR